MTVHVGEITSEVVTTSGSTSVGAQGGDSSMWAERSRVEATIERLARDRARTSTGHGDG